MHPKLPEVTALSTRFKRIQPKRLSRGFPYQAMPDCGMAFIYSGLNLNQDKATKPQTVQIVRQGEATPYWFKVNLLYHRLRRRLKNQT